MAEMRKGLFGHSFSLKASPNVEWTHCVLHREALASRHLSSELGDVMTDSVGVVNFMKTRPWKTRVFSAICEEMWAEYHAVLFHSEVRWLSQEKVLSRVFELREQIRMFLQKEYMFEGAKKFCDDNFLAKLAYLSDIYGKLNNLNLQPQWKDKHLPQVTDKISSWTQKLAMWDRWLHEGNTDSFERPAWICWHSRLWSLMGSTSLRSESWVRDPFNAQAPSGFSSAEEDQFTDMMSDSTLRLRFTDTEWILAGCRGSTHS